MEVRVQIDVPDTSPPHPIKITLNTQRIRGFVGRRKNLDFWVTLLTCKPFFSHPIREKQLHQCTDWGKQMKKILLCMRRRRREAVFEIIWLRTLKSRNARARKMYRRTNLHECPCGI